MTMIDEHARELFAVLSSHGVGEGKAVFRKKLAIRLAEESVSVADCRRACEKMQTVDGWVRACLRIKKTPGPTNQMAPNYQQTSEDLDRAFVIERFSVDGKDPEFIGAQMGWPEEKVLAILSDAGVLKEEPA